MQIKKYTARPIFRLLLLGGLIAATGLMPSSRVNANSWPQVLAAARGRTVDWYMYGGFAAANAYVNGYVAPRVMKLYGIKVRQVPIKDIAEVVGKILVEKQGA